MTIILSICMSHGFIPIIVSDACGDRHNEPHNASLFDMNAKYGDVVSEWEAIEYLQSLPKQSSIVSIRLLRVVSSELDN